jgi:anti-sigma factor RsiW
MTHAEIQTWLPGYVNRTLGEDARQIVEAHVGTCAECRQEVEALEGLVDASRAMDDELPALASDLLERTRQKILQHEQRRARAKRWSLPISLVASVVVAALFFIPPKELPDVPCFSTGGNAYYAEVILKLFIDGQIDVGEAVELMHFVP